MSDLGLLLLRVVSGGLLAGHGAQKLFGWFGGHGPGGTARFLESIGVKPGHRWAFAAGASEFGSGLLTALGFLWPIGPIGAGADGDGDGHRSLGKADLGHRGRR